MRRRLFAHTSASSPRQKGGARRTPATITSAAEHSMARLAHGLWPAALAQGALPALHSTTKCARSLPASFFASACLLQALSEGCLTGVADGVAGGSAAAGGPALTVGTAGGTSKNLMRFHLRS